MCYLGLTPVIKLISKNSLCLAYARMMLTLGGFVIFAYVAILFFGNFFTSFFASLFFYLIDFIIFFNKFLYVYSCKGLNTKPYLAFIKF